MKIAVWAKKFPGLFLFSLISLVAPAAGAEEQLVLKMLKDIVFTDTGKGVETTTLYGDPAKPGLYVVRLRLPPGARVAPHVHPGEVRTMTVLSGTLYFGFGKEWDEGRLVAYPPGTFFTELPSTPHFVAARDGEVIFQASGIGPSGMTDAH